MTFEYQYIDPNLMALFYWIKSNNKKAVKEWKKKKHFQNQTFYGHILT